MNEIKDITPEDSVVPIYLVPPTEEQIAKLEQWAIEAEELKLAEEARAAKKLAILERIGLTEEELTIVLG